MSQITPEVFWVCISERERTLQWYLLLPPMAENYCSTEYTARKSVLTARYKLKKLLGKTFLILGFGFLTFISIFSAVLMGYLFCLSLEMKIQNTGSEFPLHIWYYIAIF